MPEPGAAMAEEGTQEQKERQRGLAIPPGLPFMCKMTGVLSEGDSGCPGSELPCGLSLEGGGMWPPAQEWGHHQRANSLALFWNPTVHLKLCLQPASLQHHLVLLSWFSLQLFLLWLSCSLFSSVANSSGKVGEHVLLRGFNLLLKGFCHPTLNIQGLQEPARVSLPCTQS